MTSNYALLRSDGSLLFAQAGGQGTEVLPSAPTVTGKNVTVFVMGSNVLSLQSPINARNEAEARRAAPFAIEDDIAGAVEDVHVALGPKPSDGGARTLKAVSRVDMSVMIAILAASGLEDADIVAAHSVLPQGNCLVEVGKFVLGRLGTRTFALEAGVGADVFGGLTRDFDDVAIYGEALAQSLGRSQVGAALDGDEALLLALAKWAQDASPVSLRQGDYEVRRAASMGDLKRWRSLGVLAAVALAGWFTVTLFQTSAMQARTQTLNARIAEFTATGWPEANGNAAQAETIAHAQRRGGAVGLPPAMDLVANLYATLDGIEASQLRSLRYDRKRGVMAAVIAYDSFADGDALVAAMSRQGLTVQLGDARQSGDKVVSELTVEAAP
jgi:general secretion pathway protein L